jgi:nucleoid-associated protein YgaU
MAERGTTRTPPAEAGSATPATPRRTTQPGRSISLTGTPTAASGAQPATTGRSAAATEAGAAVDIHRVQQGDTLSSLARQYYGSERHTQFLIDSNPQLGDPNRLAVGAIVRIPPRPPDDAAPAADRAPSRTPSRAAAPGSTQTGSAAAGRTHRVQPGESFYSIARDVLHDSSRWDELFQLNRELVQGDARNLQIGQVIQLPPS